MRLSEIEKGCKFRITEINCENESVARLTALGLLPGREVRLTHQAPLGDPIAVRFDGCHITLRLKDAAEVEVEAI
ncbi:MAG: ferrous iron transport protein A [Opitutales bacterium]